jgi:Ras-related protein Rab-8A
VDDRESLVGMDYWIEELSERRLKDAMSVMLVANKCDIDDRQFSTEEGDQFASKHGIEYREVSAKTGEGVPELFEALIGSYVHRGV